MLSVSVTVAEDKAVIQGLGRLRREMPDAIRSGLSRAIQGMHREAYDWLSGAGAQASNVGAGGYPVPIRTGHLRRSLDFLPPSSRRTSEGHIWETGPLEAMLYNSAIYAAAIFAGTGSSAKFGARPVLADALKAFERRSGIAKAIEKEIAAVIQKRGMA